MNYYQTQKLKKDDIIGAVHGQLEELTAQDQVKHMGSEVFNKYKHVFEPIPHVDELPTDVYCQIQLKDASKTIATQLYSSHVNIGKCGKLCCDITRMLGESVPPTHPLPPLPSLYQKPIPLSYPTG